MNNTAHEVYWTTFTHPALQDRPLYLAATPQGLCRITWPHESLDTVRTWVEKQMPDAVLIEDPEQLSEPLQQLHEYFEGTRNTFTIPLDLRGTAFQTSVWHALTQIPHGQTRSYSDIASALGKDKAVRAVGTANGANPVPIVVPCHRVLGKNAALTGFRGGLQMKEVLLQLEGVHEYAHKGHARFQF
jgi:methylated-DNA-[protein]-cysteine S-methyltransferase